MYDSEREEKKVNNNYDNSGMFGQVPLIKTIQILPVPLKKEKVLFLLLGNK